jgi:RNA polymerase sigma factor (sigma-70 family)
VVEVSDELSDGKVIAASVSAPNDFEVIFDRHYESLRGFLGRRIAAHGAEDLAAETFVLAFANRERFDTSRSDARPWLYGIATNLLRHQHRTERRELQAYARTGVDPVLDEEPEADERIDDSRHARALAGALAALSDDERECLLLYAWADLTYGEVAEALEIAVGTVKSRIARARQQLLESNEPDFRAEREARAT